MKVAITGGIGSGKSAVAGIIKDRGYKVYSCDAIYAELLEDGPFLETLANCFGNEIIRSGRLDRKLLSQLVFKDRSALKRLNEISHPEVMRRAFSLMEGNKISFLEVPLLFENGLEKNFDRVIVVLRDIAERIKSVVLRNGIGEDEVLMRIKSQFNYDNANFAKYYVIHNDGNLSDLGQNTYEILDKIEKELF